MEIEMRLYHISLTPSLQHHRLEGESADIRSHLEKNL